MKKGFKKNRKPGLLHVAILIEKALCLYRKMMKLGNGASLNESSRQTSVSEDVAPKTILLIMKYLNQIDLCFISRQYRFRFTADLLLLSR